MNTGVVSRKRLGVVVAIPVAALLAFAAAAFACTPQATIRLSPTSGATGTNVTVTGSNMTNDATVKVFWGGISGQVMGTTTVKNGTMTLSFKVPESAPNGKTIVAANQVLNGAALGSPANALFDVNTPGGPTVAPAPVVAEENPAAVNANGAAALVDAPAAAPQTAAAAPAPAPAPRVRTAPTEAAATRAPARATAQTPVAATATQTPPPPPAAEPAPVAAPAPVAPAPEAAPATAPARRSVMVSMASDDSGSPALAIALVGIGLVLALGATAVVLAGRRDRKAPAQAKR